MFCSSPGPSCKRRVDGGLNSVLGELFTNNYGKNKTSFSFAFSSLIFVFSCLVTYNFEQVIVSLNYITLYSQIKNISSVSLAPSRSYYFSVPTWQDYLIGIRSSNQRSSMKPAVLKNFAIFIRKHLCWRLLLIRLQALLEL